MRQQEEDDHSHNGTFALLHTFPGHSKPITGLTLHPTAGLAISSSMDGSIKVLNLEAFNELFCVNVGVGVTLLKTISYGLDMACLICQEDGFIRLWRVTSCADFFGISTGEVQSLTIFNNFFPDDTEASGSVGAWEEQSVMLEIGADQGRSPNVSLLLGQEARPGSSKSSRGSSLGSDSDTEGSDDENDGGQSRRDKEGDAAGRRNAAHFGDISIADMKKVNEYVVSYAPQDLRVFSPQGNVIAKLEPTEVVDGIKSFTVSVCQELLFCLLDSGSMKVHCLRKHRAPLLRGGFPL